MARNANGRSRQQSSQGSRGGKGRQRSFDGSAPKRRGRASFEEGAKKPLRPERESNKGRGRGPKAASEKTEKPRANRIPLPKGDVSLLEGKHAFEEAIDSGVPIKTVFASDAALADSRMERYVKLAERDGARLVKVSVEELDQRSSHGAHQGVMALLQPYKYVGINAIVQAAQGKENALVVVTDHVTDAGNFGAIVRTAEVVGACGVLIPNRRNARVNTAAYKTSAGAVMHIPIAMEANLARSLQILKDEGFWVVGASEHASDLLWDAPLSGRVALVMGSEGEGLSRLTLSACDLLVKLPQAGVVESLNVAQATTALCYEWMRQCSDAKSS